MRAAPAKLLGSILNIVLSVVFACAVIGIGISASARRTREAVDAYCKRLYSHADSFATQHPSEFQSIISKLEMVREVATDSDYAALARREHDLVLPAPWRYENRVTYRLSRELEFGDMPEDVELGGPFGRFVMRYELRGEQEGEPARKTLTVHKVVEISTHRVKAGEYAAFRTFVNRADRADRREIEARRAE